MSNLLTKDQQNKDTTALWKVSGLGMELTASIGGMMLLGWLIDSWAGTGNRWMLILGLVGLIGGGYNFIRGALRYQKQAAKEAAQESKLRGDRAGRGDEPAKVSDDLFERSFPPEGDAQDFDWPDDDDSEIKI